MRDTLMEYAKYPSQLTLLLPHLFTLYYSLYTLNLSVDYPNVFHVGLTGGVLHTESSPCD